MLIYHRRGEGSSSSHFIGQDCQPVGHRSMLYIQTLIRTVGPLSIEVVNSRAATLLKVLGGRRFGTVAFLFSLIFLHVFSPSIHSFAF